MSEKIRRMSETVVMVTGSRDWPNRQMVENFLTELLSEISPHAPVTLMVGGSNSGADVFARQFWERKNLGNFIIYYPDFANDGEEAYLSMNTYMTNQSPDYVVVFVYNNSASSEYAASVSRKRGLKTYKITIEETI